MQAAVYTAIRTTEPDDAPWLMRLYAESPPRAALLDLRREPVNAIEDEVREALSKRDPQRGTFYTIEDPAGRILGFCSVRGLNPDAGFGEVAVLFLDEDTYGTPAAEEVAAFMRERAFTRLRLHKVIAHCRAGETALRAWLEAHGFTRDGVYREALFAGGGWHDIESWTLFAPEATQE